MFESFALSPLGLEVDILDLNFLMYWTRRVISQSCDLAEDLNSLFLQVILTRHDISVVGVSAGVTVSNIFQGQGHPFVQTLGLSHI